MYNLYTFCAQNSHIYNRFHCLLKSFINKPVLSNKTNKIRSFSTSKNGCLNHITHIRSDLNTLQHDLTFLTSSNIKSQCQLLEIKYKNPSNSNLSSKLSYLSLKGGEVEKLVYRILDNRLRYNMAKNNKIVKENNYKYGIVGVSMICVFGSLSLSLHPIFLAGCVVGLYFYRVVFRQSMLRKGTLGTHYAHRSST